MTTTTDRTDRQHAIARELYKCLEQDRAQGYDPEQHGPWDPTAADVEWIRDALTVERAEVLAVIPTIDRDPL